MSHSFHSTPIRCSRVIGTRWLAPNRPHVQSGMALPHPHQPQSPQEVQRDLRLPAPDAPRPNAAQQVLRPADPPQEDGQGRPGGQGRRGPSPHVLPRRQPAVLSAGRCARDAVRRAREEDRAEQGL